ncbi:MAG: selenium cofactor biosynthesis protein YqeC [Halofilum sp. (in: g-proteobacteria)]
MKLLDALEAHTGIVCAVGAGGKKTTLYALASEHPGPIGLTTTVFMTQFSRRLGPHAEVISDADDLAPIVREAASRERVVAWARPTEKSGRVAGVAPGSVSACHAAGGFDVTYVKADGARMRGIKAPREGEPAIPPEADLVLPIVAATVIGRPLDADTAHRPERLTAVTGLEHGAAITAETVGRLLSASDGALQDVPDGARIVPVINAVDDDAHEREARHAAAIALAGSPRIERVVLTRHDRGGHHVVAVVER